MKAETGIFQKKKEEPTADGMKSKQTSSRTELDNSQG